MRPVAFEIGMAARTLPYDAEVEWLESYPIGTTGRSGPCINTGIIPTQTARFELDWTPFTTGGQVLTGVGGFSLNGAAANTRFVFGHTYSQNRKLYFGVSNLNSWPFNLSWPSGSRVKQFMQLDGSSAVVGYNDNQTTLSISLYNNVDCPVYLFARSTIQPREGFYYEIERNTRARIHSAKIWAAYENGLSRDFIPVRVGDVGYMFDRVTGALFGNAGTGAFVVGPDKVSSAGGGGGI